MSSHADAKAPHQAPRACMLVIAVVSALLAGAAQAAELVFDRGAVQRLVEDALYKDRGRAYLQPDPCYAYLEHPQVTLAGGRVVIRTHLALRLGVVADKKCLGAGLTTWATVSGKAVASAGAVRLDDVRIDSVDESTLRTWLKLMLLPRLPGTIELDVTAALKNMLGSARLPLKAQLERFAFESVTADRNELNMRFDFRLRGTVP